MENLFELYLYYLNYFIFYIDIYLHFTQLMVYEIFIESLYSKLLQSSLLFLAKIKK
jgi:hypothetical protein